MYGSSPVGWNTISLMSALSSQPVMMKLTLVFWQSTLWFCTLHSWLSISLHWYWLLPWEPLQIGQGRPRSAMSKSNPYSRCQVLITLLPNCRSSASLIASNGH